MATLTMCRHRWSSLSRCGASYERLSAGPVELTPRARQDEAADSSDDEPVPWLYLTDASDSGMRVLRYFVLNKCMLNVDSDAAGIAYWLDWMGAIVEIALFEERDPHDPEFPRLKLVGVYPVIDGWAHINLKELAGKGQDYYSPLYIAPGSAIMKRLGLGLERRLESPNIVKAITGTKIPSVSAQRSWNRKGPKHALRDESALETM